MGIIDTNSLYGKSSNIINITKKRIYTSIAACLIFFNIQAQTFEWAKTEGLWAYDIGYGIVNDHSGNVYVTGRYEQNAIFSGDTLNDEGLHDMFLAKYNSLGELDWTRTAGGPLGDYARALATDKSYLYIAGEIEGYGVNITFSNSPDTLYSLGDNDLLVAKYDLDGNLLWAKSDGWYYNEKAMAVTCDSVGNVFIAGYFSDTTSLGGVLYGSKGGKDILICKYDANGNFLWARTAGGPGRDEALAIQCDMEGNVYMCGMHSDSAMFESQIVNSPMGNYDVYLAKYNAAGDLLWVQSHGSDYHDIGWSLALDNDGKIYMAGEFNAYAIFGALSVVTSGTNEVFVACYDSTGTPLWVKSAGGLQADRARGINFSGDKLYITGQFGGEATFGTSTITAADSSDIFIAALNTAGDFLWATSVGGPADNLETFGYESGTAICAEASGNVYVTGALLDGGVFGDSSPDAYTRTDVFITKLNSTIITATQENNFQNVTVYPNPAIGNFTIDMTSLQQAKTSVTVYNYMGQIVYQQSNTKPLLNIDLSTMEKGVYFTNINSENTSHTVKVILQ